MGNFRTPAVEKVIVGGIGTPIRDFRTPVVEKKALVEFKGILIKDYMTPVVENKGSRRSYKDSHRRFQDPIGRKKRLW